MQTRKGHGEADDLDLCLDFADTTNRTSTDPSADGLSSYSDLIAWSRAKGILEADVADRLVKLVKKRGLEEDTMREAKALREAIFGIFSAVAHGGKVGSADLGVLNGYLHNLTTARKWKTESTGNAGLLSPRAWNLEVGAGDASYDEMVKEMKRGIVLTSNWYTRFKNQRTGELSTVPRDGAYLVEGGRIVKPVKGMRLSDDLPRMFSSVQLLSKQREWVEWWEVHTPTLCPWILVDGAKITKAYD